MYDSLSKSQSIFLIHTNKCIRFKNSFINVLIASGGSKTQVETSKVPIDFILKLTMTKNSYTSCSICLPVCQTCGKGTFLQIWSHLYSEKKCYRHLFNQLLVVCATRYKVGFMSLCSP